MFQARGIFVSRNLKSEMKTRKFRNGGRRKEVEIKKKRRRKKVGIKKERRRKRLEMKKERRREEV